MSMESAEKPAAEIVRRFLDSFIKESNDSIFGDQYRISGVLWNGRRYETHDGLSTHRDDGAMLDVGVSYSGEGFRWSYAKKLAEGVYLRYDGKSADIETACAKAYGYEPRHLGFDYLTGVTAWYETEPGRFFAEIDGDEAQVMKTGPDDYRFTRSWVGGKEVFALLNGFGQCLSGDASTVEAAMIACIEAPDRFKRACAALVASLRVKVE